jgi:hypothetical protein
MPSDRWLEPQGSYQLDPMPESDELADSLPPAAPGQALAPPTGAGPFPVEPFLPIGEDHAGDTRIGVGCHRRQRESKLPVARKTRQRFYGALAAAGLGHSCFATATRR